MFYFKLTPSLSHFKKFGKDPFPAFGAGLCFGEKGFFLLGSFSFIPGLVGCLVPGFVGATVCSLYSPFLAFGAGLCFGS